MKKTMIGIALLALAAGFGSACGGDDSTTPTKSGSAGSKAGVAGSGGPVYCAKEICKVPAGLGADVEACCMDQFNGGCGIKSGSSCRPLPAPPDDRCPVPDFTAGIMIPGAGGAGAATSGIVVVGCCTDKNECGIDFGMGGCQPRTVACMFVPKSNVDSIKPMTCDGTPIDLPADCGASFSFPGAGGAGGS
jgi:hypothetical protein